MSNTKPHPVASQGVLDLRKWDFEKHGPIDLKGEWEFYWKQLLSPADFASVTGSEKSSAITKKTPEKSYIQAPGKWNAHVVDGKEVGGQGFATYRLRVILPEAAANLGLIIPDQESAHNLVLNGKRIASNGIVAKTEESYRPFYLPMTVTIQGGKEAEIILQVANFEHKNGGAIKPITIGNAATLFQKTNRARLLDGFIAGALIIMGLYHFALHFYRRKDRGAFWFALLCLTMSLRLAVTGERLLIETFPDVPWLFFFKLAYLSMYALVPIFASFLYSLFPVQFSRFTIRLLVTMSLPAIATVMILPAKWFTYTLPPYQIFMVAAYLYVIFVLVRSALSKQQGARLILFGALIFFVAGINDMLYNRFLIGPGFVLPLGLFFFIFAQAGALAHRIAAAFNSSEDLSANLEAKVEERTRELSEAREASDKLLHNILPVSTAQELKETGAVIPQHFESASVLFTDFVGFTKISETMSASDLIRELDGCFSQFDEVIKHNNLEKLKTIGDAYMCAGGIPTPNKTHAVDACLAALEFRDFMLQMQEIKAGLGLPYWQLRIGINSGPVTAGVVGTNKFAYDIWGDTVNIASRMESSGTPGQINISAATYERVKDFFDCDYRGKIEAKGKGEVDMYYLLRLNQEFSADAEGRIPNAKFEVQRVAAGL